MKLLIIGLLALLVAGCESQEEQEQQRRDAEYRKTARVIRVCPDGTMIFRMADERRFTSGFFPHEVHPDIKTEEICVGR